MHYLSLGDTDEIAASCHYLSIAGTGIVLDAGMDPESDGMAALPSFGLLGDRPIDHVVITHAHHDHLGALPVLMRRVPHARVHMSRPTALLADVLLPSSARLQARRVREGSSTAAPVFDAESVEALSYLYETHLLDTSIDLGSLDAAGSLSARFYHAGHVLGAVGVLLETKRAGASTPQRLFYTSDTRLRAQTILPGGDYPEAPVDVLLLETTLGTDPDAERVTWDEEERHFAETLKRAIEREGVALVPVFALGRAQEMLALINRFKSEGILPEETPVYSAGQLRGISGIYDQTRLMSPRCDPRFELAEVEQLRIPRTQTRFDDALREPGVFVVSSGMLFERTLSNRVAQQIVGNEKNSILFVGFCKEGSPGDRLQQAAAQEPGTRVVLDPEAGSQPVYAEVNRFRFSGHAHRRDLLALVDRLEPKKVVLVHGEKAAKHWMKDNILFAHPNVDVVIPEHGVELEL